MVPGPWAAVVLVLAAFRISRLVGWDDLPPVARLRAWMVGEEVTRAGSTNARLGLTDEEPEEVVTYRRETLNHFIHCAFCFGAWVSAALYILWLWFPTETMYAVVPFALSAAVGLVAKNLDP